MKSIELNRQFIVALHTFNMDEVRKTDAYKAMVSESDGRAEDIDLVVERVMAELRAKQSVMTPEEWKKLVNDISTIGELIGLSSPR